MLNKHLSTLMPKLKNSGRGVLDVKSARLKADRGRSELLPLLSKGKAGAVTYSRLGTAPPPPPVTVYIRGPIKGYI